MIHGSPYTKIRTLPERTFKRSRDPSFAAKLADIVGLGACPRAGHRPDPWVDPPAHAVVRNTIRPPVLPSMSASSPGAVTREAFGVGIAMTVEKPSPTTALTQNRCY